MFQAITIILNEQFIVSYSFSALTNRTLFEDFLINQLKCVVVGVF